MKRIICLFILLAMALSLASCGLVRRVNAPKINGTKITKFTIVYDEEGLDYNKRAAEYIRDTIFERSGIKLSIVDDSEAESSHEIVVGETARDISAELNAETEGLEFAILAKDGSVALEGDYFIIAAAAYFFTEAYVFESGYQAEIPEEASVYTPITKEAKNFIMLIGDGMGLMHTKLFDYMDDTPEFSDGEDIFYGELLPYHGFSRTESLSGVTDSAAGGTALACGYKTYNEYVGRDKDGNDVKSLTELAFELGMGGGVMSTETDTGATPSTFSAHADNRDSNLEILKSQMLAKKNYGTVIQCGFNFYTAKDMATIEGLIAETLDTVSADGKNFFLMYEEAYIDKHCHNNDLEQTFAAVVRFNQAIGRFMEYAFYHPDTLVLITADHETGGITLDEEGKVIYTTEEHTLADVPVFAYGKGAELFDGKTVENIQIGQTFAALMGDDSFGDQSTFKPLTK